MRRSSGSGKCSFINMNGARAHSSQRARSTSRDSSERIDWILLGENEACAFFGGGTYKCQETRLVSRECKNSIPAASRAPYIDFPNNYSFYAVAEIVFFSRNIFRTVWT